MACEVGQYLPDGDDPEPRVEDLVHMEKRVLRGRPVLPRRPKFMPRPVIELLVETPEGDRLQVLGFVEKGNRFVAELHFGDLKLRAMHTHPRHCNPGSSWHMSDGHIHFPTKEFPQGRYAYEVYCPDDCEFLEFLQDFAAVINLDISDVQLGF